MSEENTNLSIFGQSTDVMPTYAASDTNMGNESVGVDDMTLPQIKVLQPLSPEMESIDGAKSGMLCNSVTNELYDSVYVVNLGFKKQFSVFKVRTKGGGFFGAFESEVAAKEHVGTLDGNIADYQIVETGVHSLLVLDAEGKPKSPAIMYFKATSLAASRNWNSMIVSEGNGAPRFASVWLLKSKKNSNDRGTWWTPEASFAGFAPQSLYDAAKEQHDALKNAESGV